MYCVPLTANDVGTAVTPELVRCDHKILPVRASNARK